MLFKLPYNSHFPMALSNINNLVNLFWSEVFVLHKDSSIMLIVKFDFGACFCASDRSFSKVLIVNYEDKNLVLTNLKFYFEMYNSHYTVLTPENLLINYKILPKRTSKILKVKYN